MKILIIEDSLYDIKYYENLKDLRAEVSFLFVAPREREREFTESKIKEHIELLYGDSFLWIKNYFVLSFGKEIMEFLNKNHFDFYIFDSLRGAAKGLIINSGIPKDRIAILSSTREFRDLMEGLGYLCVYQKENINKLIQRCILPS